MLQAIKVRLYPDSEQKGALEKAFGTTRWLWNYFLDLTNKTYKETGKGIARFDMNKMLPPLKKEYPWLKETYAQCLQAVTLNMSRAFINFFEKRSQYPRFKSKSGKQSLTFPQNVKILDGEIKFPKLGKVFAVIHRPIEGKVKTVTITKAITNKYYASILVDDGKELPTPSREGKALGIDVGLTHFAITSDGEQYDNPRWLESQEKNLLQKQKDLSRKKRGSKNRNKSRIKVAKVHEKISRSREDFHHKLSRRIVGENQVIIVENLNIKGMVKNYPPAFGTPLTKGGWGGCQVGWGQFLTMLKYKAEREGKIYLEIDRFFPSSKTCNNCLNVVGSLPLDIRRWSCEHCGQEHDRDINAAMNIKDEGLRILTSGTGDKAYCPDVRRDSRGRKKSTVSQFVG